MYNPEHFKNLDLDKLFKVIDDYPFATIISDDEVNHLPLYRDGMKLVGHMSRKNPLALGKKVKVVFHGPHTYINSSWYTKNDVPTWNYVVVHVSGSLKLIEDAPGILKILKFSNDHINGLYPDKWDMYVPEDLRGSNLTNAIVGFEISIEHMEGKFKLSQNRSEADQQGVIQGLSKRSDDMDRKIKELMEKN